MQKAWRELCADDTPGKNDRERSFTAAVNACEDGNYDVPAVKRFATVTDTTEEGAIRLWMSWKEFVDAEGYDVAIEL